MCNRTSKRRKEFVENYLSEAVCMAGVDVESLEYYVKGSSEFVKVMSNDGYTKVIDVTNNTPIDILKAVGRVFH